MHHRSCPWFNINIMLNSLVRWCPLQWGKQLSELLCQRFSFRLCYLYCVAPNQVFILLRSYCCYPNSSLFSLLDTVDGLESKLSLAFWLLFFPGRKHERSSLPLDGWLIFLQPRHAQDNFIVDVADDPDKCTCCLPCLLAGQDCLASDLQKISSYPTQVWLLFCQQLLHDQLQSFRNIFSH